jgi:uncharacterized membrane protein YoaK (UPF0700 family)
MYQVFATKSKESFRNTCLILVAAFSFVSIAIWGQLGDFWMFLSENLMWCLISMAIFYYAVNTLKAEAFPKVAVFWILPIVNLLCWEVVGNQRLHTATWLRFVCNTSWSVIIGFGVILAAANVKPDAKDDFKKLNKRWCTFMLIVLTVRVFAELMLVCVVGFPANNIVEFIINVTLFTVMVYPWALFNKEF